MAKRRSPVSYLICVLAIPCFLGGFFQAKHEEEARVKKQNEKVARESSTEELQWELAYAQASRDLYKAQAEVK